jgi:hypothetical protein
MNPEGQKDLIDAASKVDQGKEGDWAQLKALAFVYANR